MMIDTDAIDGATDQLAEIMECIDAHCFDRVRVTGFHKHSDEPPSEASTWRGEMGGFAQTLRTAIEAMRALSGFVAVTRAARVKEL